MLNTSQKVFPVNAAISKQKVLHGLKQVAQAQRILIPVKWEQSTDSSFSSQTWDGLPCLTSWSSRWDVSEFKCWFVFFSFRPGKHEGLGLEFVKFLFCDSLRQPCTRSTEKWAHLAPKMWLREQPRRTCVHSCLWRANSRRSLAENEVKPAPG